MKNMPQFQVHTKVQQFFRDPSVPMWLKMIHLFILIDSKSKKKDGFTVWYQNPGLQRKFSVSAPNGEVIWEPHVSTIQQSVAKLEAMGLITREVSNYGERRIKLNRSLIISFLRSHNLEDEFYVGFRAKSRERKLIRRKILTVVDYINTEKRIQSAQFKQYLLYQQKKYGYDIEVPDVDLFDIDIEFDRFITPEELELHLDQHQNIKLLDRIWNNMRTDRAL